MVNLFNEELPNTDIKDLYYSIRKGSVKVGNVKNISDSEYREHRREFREELKTYLECIRVEERDDYRNYNLFALRFKNINIKRLNWCDLFIILIYEYCRIMDDSSAIIIQEYFLRNSKYYREDYSNKIVFTSISVIDFDISNYTDKDKKLENSLDRAIYTIYTDLSIAEHKTLVIGIPATTNDKISVLRALGILDCFSKDIEILINYTKTKKRPMTRKNINSKKTQKVIEDLKQL